MRHGRNAGAVSQLGAVFHPFVNPIESASMPKYVFLVVGVYVAGRVRRGNVGGVLAVGIVSGVGGGDLRGVGAGRARRRLVLAGFGADPGSSRCIVSGGDDDRGAWHGGPAARLLEEGVFAREDPLSGLFASPGGGGARAAQFPRAPIPPCTALGASDDGEGAVSAYKSMPQVGEVWGIFGHPSARASLVSAVGRDRAGRNVIVTQAASPRPCFVPPQVPLTRARLGLRGRLRRSSHTSGCLRKTCHRHGHRSDDQRCAFGVVLDVCRHCRVGRRMKCGGKLGGFVSGGIPTDIGGLARSFPAPCRTVGLSPSHRHALAFLGVGHR